MLSLRTVAGSSSAHTALNRHTRALRKNVAQLSSGKRIQSAADDPAGSAMATKFKAQARSSMVAIRNANDGISMMEITEAALARITDMTHRMRSLATHSMSDGVTDSERSYLDTEFQSIKGALERTNAATEFNGIALTNNGGTHHFATHHDGSGIDVALGTHTAGDLGLVPNHLGTRDAAGAALSSVDIARTLLNSSRAKVGSAINALSGRRDFEQDQLFAMQSSRSAIEDLDYAKASTDYSRNSILQYSAVAMLAQAIKGHSVVLKLLL